MITALPADLAVTIPSLSTDATEELEERHVTLPVGAFFRSREITSPTFPVQEVLLNEINFVSLTDTVHL